MAVMQAAGRAALKQMPKDTVLEIPTLTESSAKLVKKLLPTGQATSLVRALLDFSAFYMPEGEGFDSERSEEREM